MLHRSVETALQASQLLERLCLQPAHICLKLTNFVCQLLVLLRLGGQLDLLQKSCVGAGQRNSAKHMTWCGVTTTQGQCEFALGLMSNA